MAAFGTVEILIRRLAQEAPGSTPETILDAVDKVLRTPWKEGETFYETKGLLKTEVAAMIRCELEHAAEVAQVLAATDAEVALEAPDKTAEERRTEVLRRSLARSPRRHHLLDAADFSRMHLPHEFWRARLGQVPDSVRGAVANYCADARNFSGRGLGFVFLGGAGVGKTGAACVLAKELRSHTRSVFFTTVSDMREFVKNRIPFDSDATVWERCRDVDCLVLDALGSDDPADKYVGATTLASLVETRAQWKRVTIVTSRLTESELVQQFPGLYEALRPVSPMVLVTGKNMRDVRAESTARALGLSTPTAVPTDRAVAPTALAGLPDKKSSK